MKYKNKKYVIFLLIFIVNIINFHYEYKPKKMKEKIIIGK